MSDYHHGVQVLEINDGTRVISTVSTAIVGMVCTASDADAETFPLNKPVLITNVQSAIAKAGKKGTLAASLQAIADQSKPVTVVVRVEDGTGDDEETKLAQTVSNIIGTTDENGQYTGLKALMGAESVTGVKPRILGVPGLDTKEVAVALASVCQELNAFGYISAWGCKTISEVKAYRQNFSQRELMVIWPDFLAWDTVTSTTATAYATARALGLRAKIDQEQGWHKTLSNVGVLEKLGVINKESDTLDQTAARTQAATYGSGGYIPATSSYAGYQAYQPVTAPAGRSYVDQSKNEYHISLTGGTAPGTQLDRQLQDALEKYERDKRARARASMMHDG